MSTPEIIYLIHGEYDGEQGMVWCDCAAPDSYCDPDEAVKYVRADTLPLPVLSRFPPEGEGMPRYGLHWDGPTKPLSVPMDCGYWTPWHLASAENKRLQARVAELQEEIGHLEDRVISQGQQLREIVNITKGPQVDKIHSTHDAVESVELLHARIVELELEEVGAKKAFAAVSEKKTSAESRVVELEKSIVSLMTELYGKKRNDAGAAGCGV